MEEMTGSIKTWLGNGSIDFFGRPFSGKDTQGKILADLFGGSLISGGDILRSHHDPAAIEKIMAEGGIIPSDFYLSMVVPYLSKDEFRGRPLMLSAVGRSHGEEPIIEQATEASGHRMKAVIVLELSDEDVWQRYDAAKELHDRGERSEDRAEALRNRLNKYRDNTEPVIDYYDQKGLLVRIDGRQSEEDVTRAIIEQLAAFSAASD